MQVDDLVDEEEQPSAAARGLANVLMVRERAFGKVMLLHAAFNHACQLTVASHVAFACP